MDMAARIEVDASFSNWQEWNETLESFKSNHQVEFSVFRNTSVVAANKGPPHHPDTHQYAYAQYGCVHSGSRAGEPKLEVRP